MKKKTVLFIIIFIIGCVVGALFYPSKTIIKTVEVDKKSTLEELAKVKSELISIETQNKKLKQQIKEHSVTIVNPDGSSVTTVDTETTIEEYETKVKEITQKYESEIAFLKTELEKSKEYQKIEINRRRVGVEVGYLINIQSYYLHTQADLFGPIFIGVQLQAGIKNSLGFGIGFKF